MEDILNKNSTNLSWIKLFSFVYRHIKLNIVMFVMLTILSVIIVFFVMRLQYTAETTILPPSGSGMDKFAGALGNIASIAGIDMGGVTFQNPMMYAGLLKSRKLLEPVIYKKYSTGSDSLNLIELLEIEGKNKREEFQKTLKYMRKTALGIDIDDDNMILTLTVTLPDPRVAADVANYMIRLLDNLVKNKLQHEFYEQREYIKKRLSQVSDSLEIVENNFKNFLENSQDPTLPSFQIEQIRLKRQIEVHSAVYIELKKQLEILYVQNFMNLAPVKILDFAQPPYRKSRPKRLFVLISLLLLFGILQFLTNAGIFFYGYFRGNLLPKLKRM